MKKRHNGCYSPYLCMEGLLVSYSRVIGKILMQKIIDGYEPSEGDIILGDINSNGFKDVYFPLKDRESRVYVEDYSMSESRAFEHYNEHCNS